MPESDVTVEPTAGKEYPLSNVWPSVASSSEAEHFPRQCDPVSVGRCCPVPSLTGKPIATSSFGVEENSSTCHGLAQVHDKMPLPVKERVKLARCKPAGVGDHPQLCHRESYSTSVRLHPTEVQSRRKIASSMPTIGVKSMAKAERGARLK